MRINLGSGRGPASRHVLPWRHQTGSELVVLHGRCLAAEGSARAPKPARAAFFFYADHGRVSARTRFPPFADSFAFLPFLPRVSLATGPHLREPLASPPHSCCCLFVGALPFPSNRLSDPAWRPLVRHVPCLSVFVWLEVSRDKTNDWAAAFDRQKSRDISLSTDVNTHGTMFTAFFLFESLKWSKYPHVLTITCLIIKIQNNWGKKIVPAHNRKTLITDVITVSNSYANVSD